MKTKVIVADYREVIRAGLRGFLSRTQVEVVAEAASGKETVRLVRSHEPDVLVLGCLSDEPGLSTLNHIRTKGPQVPVLMCGYDDNPTYEARSLALGAAGCFSLGFSRAELLSAIREAAAGGNAWSREQLRRYTGAPEVPAEMEVRLTPREREVLRQLSFGLPNREIGLLLDISVETVKEHVASIRQKLDVTDRTRAAVWAIKHGLD